MDLIDQQVRETATALFNSELVGLRNIEFERVDKIISEELGENRVGKLFIIRNNAGRILFESAGAKILPIRDIPRDPRWITLRSQGQYIRILNLSLPSINDRTLQVGVMVSEDLLSPGYYTRANLLFTGGIVALGLLVAWILTALLMRPISHLSNFISEAAYDRNQRMELPALPKELQKFAKLRSAKDELSNLLSGFEKLIDRVNRDYRLSRFWSYQMAHELKTPMAIIEAQVAEAQSQSQIPDETAKSILCEVFEASETITGFLSWAEVENATAQKRLFVVRASKVAEDVFKRLKVTFPGRLQLNIFADFNIVSNIQHIEQALNNLILNALIYSPSGTPVVVELNNNAIRITDHGPGIPFAVMQRIGEPFNKGEGSAAFSKRKGNGLGLALVQSIAKLYDWKIHFSSDTAGTSVCLTFPNLPVEPVAANP